MADPYSILGVEKTVSDDAIRSAYRNLAKKFHPDLNPGNPEAERRFKEISGANDIVGDPEKRRRYDAGEIDETGADRPERRFYRDFAEGSGRRKYEPQGGSAHAFEDLGGIFGDLFRNAQASRQPGSEHHFQMPGRDVSYALEIEFLEAVNGARKRIDMPDGRTLDVTIPMGLDDGQVIRLKGQGLPGVGGGQPGDALIGISVRPHPTFRRDGKQISSVVAVTLNEAVSGGLVRVETIAGPVEVRVPKGSNSGRVLRLRGKGVPVANASAGDHLVELRVMLPEQPDAAFETFIQDWERQHPYDPRRPSGASR